MIDHELLLAEASKEEDSLLNTLQAVDFQGKS